MAAGRRARRRRREERGGRSVPVGERRSVPARQKRAEPPEIDEAADEVAEDEVAPTTAAASEPKFTIWHRFCEYAMYAGLAAQVAALVVFAVKGLMGDGREGAIWAFLVALGGWAFIVPSVITYRVYRERDMMCVLAVFASPLVGLSFGAFLQPASLAGAVGIFSGLTVIIVAWRLVSRTSKLNSHPEK